MPDTWGSAGCDRSCSWAARGRSACTRPGAPRAPQSCNARGNSACLRSSSQVTRRAAPLLESSAPVASTAPKTIARMSAATSCWRLFGASTLVLRLQSQIRAPGATVAGRLTLGLVVYRLYAADRSDDSAKKLLGRLVADQHTLYNVVAKPGNGSAADRGMARDPAGIRPIDGARRFVSCRDDRSMRELADSRPRRLRSSPLPKSQRPRPPSSLDRSLHDKPKLPVAPRRLASRRWPPFRHSERRLAHT
jgi:hypothetical protein